MTNNLDITLPREFVNGLKQENQRLRGMLKEIDRDLGFCIVCRSHEIDWAGLKVHKDDCRLMKELSDDTP
jgi:hypothetical protein